MNCPDVALQKFAEQIQAFLHDQGFRTNTIMYRIGMVTWVSLNRISCMRHS